MYKPLSLQNDKIAYYFIIIIVRLCAFFLILVIHNYHEYLTYVLTLVKQIENSNFIDIIQAHTPAECGSREWCEETWKRDKSNFADYPYPYPWFKQTWLKKTFLTYPELPEDWEPYAWEVWLGWDHPKYEVVADAILIVSFTTIAGIALYGTGYFIHQWFF